MRLPLIGLPPGVSRPYFAPGGAPYAEVLSPATSFTDVGALAGPPESTYYVVRAVSSAGLTSADSKRTGEFGFDLAEGSR